jgi:hypothetical protein
MCIKIDVIAKIKEIISQTWGIVVRDIPKEVPTTTLCYPHCSA